MPRATCYEVFNEPFRTGFRSTAGSASAAPSVSNGSGVVVAVGSVSALGSSKPSASDISSTFGRSPDVVQPEALEELARRRIHERPADHLLAADGLDQWRSTSVESTPPLLLTPRISAISGAVIGCLYAMTASVSSACTDSFCVVRS